MVDWLGIVKIIGLLAVAFFLFTIASEGGLEGKFFVLFVIGIGVIIYLRNQAANKIINPVQVYYDRLALACKRKGKVGLRFLVMSGDAHNQRYVKGEILGGPLILPDRTMLKIPTKWKEEKNEEGKKVRVATEWKFEPKFAKDHPYAYRYYFLYTPSYGSVYSLPVVGGLLASLRKECLICVFKPQLRSLQMLGDVEIKGVNTRFVEQMEYLSDEFFDYDFEADGLYREVDRITLGDEMTQLPTRIRRAVDSNSQHVRELDKKDFPVGAVAGETTEAT